MLTLSQMPEAIRDFLEARQLTRTAAFADENPAHLPPAIAAVADLVLQGLAELAGQPTTRQRLWDLAHAAATAPAPHSAGLTKEVLSDRYHGTTSAVAKETEVATATIAQLIDLEEGAALALVGSLATERHWDAQQLGEWLRPRRFAPVAAPLAASAPAAAPAPAATSWLAAPANILLVLVSLVAVGEFGYILNTRSAGSDPAALSTAVDGAPAAPASQYKIIPTANVSAARPAGGEGAVPVVLKLKNGLRQVIGATSTESKLYQFLIDPGQQVDAVDPTKGWIGFDRIYFESSKATLTNESLWQLSNVASILKRFPVAKIKIGGYTDNSGNPLNNLRLSTERAQAAKEALVSLGVAPERLTAVGYGVLDNIAPNETEEGRALNRRVSLQVTEK